MITRTLAHKSVHEYEKIHGNDDNPIASCMGTVGSGEYPGIFTPGLFHF